jgi:hypothetical protein
MDEEKLIDFHCATVVESAWNFLSTTYAYNLLYHCSTVPQIYRTNHWRGILQSSMDE